MKKGNVLLDLDETLLSSQETEKFDIESGKLSKFRWENMDDIYIVVERPHLQEFLTVLFRDFNVSIWTAASKEYASFIAENIILKGDKKRKIDYILFQEHGKISDKKYNKSGSKELRLLWEYFHLPGFNKDNTFIIDDNPNVYSSQLSNAIIAKPFDYKDTNSDKDKFLLKLQDTLNEIKTAISNNKPIGSIIKNFNKK